MSTIVEGAGAPLPGATDLRVLGPLGFGARGTLWSAMTPAGERVAVRRLAPRPVEDPGAARRLCALTDVRSEHVASVLEVRPVAGATLLISEIVPGPTLATVRAGTAGLSRPECWRLLVDLCAGLAALHRRGLVHGDVAPANVILRPVEAGVVPSAGDLAQGRATRPVLVDLGGLGGSWGHGGHGGWEEGTAGFRAPELRAGAAASAAADVWSAARVAVWAVAEHERARLTSELSGVLQDDPGRRLGAATLARLGRERAAEAIEIPDRASLARARLREQAQRDPTRLARGHRSRHSSRSRPGSGRRASRERRARRTGRTRRTTGPIRRGRARRARDAIRWRGRLLILLAALVVVAAGAGLLLHVGPAGPMSRSLDVDLSVATGAGDAVDTLTAWRDAALNGADTGALLRLSLPDSPAAHADATLAASLAREHPVALTTQVEVIATGGTAARPRVRALLTQPRHERVGAAGASWLVPAGEPRCVEIELGGFKGRWRVGVVEPCGLTP